MLFSCSVCVPINACLAFPSPSLAWSSDIGTTHTSLKLCASAEAAFHPSEYVQYMTREKMLQNYQTSLALQFCYFSGHFRAKDYNSLCCIPSKYKLKSAHLLLLLLLLLLVCNIMPRVLSPRSSRSRHSRNSEQDQVIDEDEERSLNLQTVNGAVRRSNIPSLTCAFLSSLTTGGTTYAFGLYGDALKKTLRLSQPQLDTISTANFCAGLFSWIPGLIVDTLGTKTGLIAGGIQGAVSLTLYWGVAKQYIPLERDLLVPILSLLGVFIFLSCALITGAVFKIIVSTCGAGTKGTAVGAAKGYVGLGAGLYASLFEAFRTKGQSDLDFLLMAAFFFIACVVLPAAILMPSNERAKAEDFQDESTPFHFRTLYCSLMAMATLIIFNSLAELYEHDDPTTETEDDHDGPNVPMVLFLLTIWVGPILGIQLLPRRTTLDMADPLTQYEEEEEEQENLLTENGDNGEVSMHNIKRRSKPSILNDNSARSLNSTGSHRSLPVALPESPSHVTVPDLLHVPDSFGENDDNVESWSDDAEEAQGDDNKNLYQMLQTPTAQLMLFTTTILVGGGIVETNNMGQMVEALHFPRETASASLAFFSVAQSAARVVTGALSESALNWPTRSCCIDEGVPRPFFLAVAAIVGVISHFVLAVATSKYAFVVGVTLCGAAFGMSWPLLVLIVGEVFGTENVGANYMFFDGFTSAAGSLLLSKFVAQEVYESHVDRTNDPENVTCLGQACFSATHYIIVALSAICIFTSLCMLYTTKHIYNRGGLHKDK